MDQAILAARTIEEDGDPRMARLLETSMVVAYMRPFTKSKLVQLADYAPTEEPDRTLHETLADLRDQAYAHTDVTADRTVGFSVGDHEGDWVPYGERFTPLSPEFLAGLVDLAGRIRDGMYAEARDTWRALGQPQGWFGPRGADPGADPEG